MELKAKLFCDDVRQEVGNKLTVVGIYNDSIIVTGAPPGRVAMPKLASLFVVTGMRGVTRFEYRHWYKFGDAPDPEVPWVTDVHNPATSDHNFINQLVPAVFPGSGPFQASLDLRIGDETRRFDLVVSVEIAKQEQAGPGSRTN